MGRQEQPKMEFLEIELYQVQKWVHNQLPVFANKMRNAFLPELTSTLREGGAPLSVSLADGLRSPMQNVPGIADKTYIVI